MATSDTTNFFTKSSPVSELGAVAQRLLDVLLRPVVAQDVLNIGLGAGVGLALQHRAVRVGDDSDRALAQAVAKLGAVADRVAHLLLIPAIVDDAAAVLLQARGIRVAAENVLVRALDDAIGVTAPVAAATLVLQIAEAAAVLPALNVHTQRRHAIVPAFAPEVADVAAESPRVATEPRVAEHDDLGTAEDPDGRNLIVHVVGHGADVGAGGHAEILPAEVAILEETRAAL